MTWAHVALKIRKWNDETLRVVGAGYRCQGRFKTNLKSQIQS